MAPPDAVFVRSDGQWVRVLLVSVLYVEADDNSTVLHTITDRHVLARMMKDVLTELGDAVERVHRSYAVNLQHVVAISEEGLHVGVHVVPVGRSYRPTVLQRLRMI